MLQPGSSLSRSPTTLYFCVSWNFLTTVVIKGEGVNLTPTHRLVDQASVFISSRDRVVQLYPRTLGYQFSRLLRHAWTTLGLFLFPTTTREVSKKNPRKTFSSLQAAFDIFALNDCSVPCTAHYATLPAAQQFSVCWIGVTGSR